MNKFSSLLALFFVVLCCVSQHNVYSASLLGGYSEAPVDEEVKNIWNTHVDAFFLKQVGGENINSTPVINSVSTQVVAGTNYEYDVTFNEHDYLVTVYCNLQDKYSITSIEEKK